MNFIDPKKRVGRELNDAVADGGRVAVNGKIVKPSYEVKVGDIVEIKFGDKISKFEVLKLPTTQNVKDMTYMFERCKNFNQPLNDWNVSNVTDMECMFSVCEKFNQPLDQWDVGKVTNMHAMFDRCNAFNQSLNDWDVSSVTSMRKMFKDCVSYNQPLNDWAVREDCICNNAFIGSNLSYANVKDAFTELQLENSNSDKIFDEQADIKKAQMAKEKTSSVNVDLDAVKSKLRKATRF